MMWIDSAEEFQAGSREVINPHALQILVSTPDTPFSQVGKASVQGIQLQLGNCVHRIRGKVPQQGKGTRRANMNKSCI